MEKVAIYCRLSDEDNNKKNIKESSESIQNQKNLLMKYSMEKQWDVYKIYCDEDYSGLDGSRPEFSEMIRDAQKGKFDIILCKTQSRFTRDMELVEKYLHNKFIQWGIRFVTVVDGADTMDKHNKKSRQINGLVNEWYCEDISDSIKAVLRLKQKSGKFIGAFAPYGYIKDDNDKNKLVIDKEAAKVVVLIFNLYLKGYGFQKIASTLNEMGIDNPTNYKKSKGFKYKNASAKDDYGLWNKTTIKRMLKNETYIGNMVQHKHKKLSYKSKKTVNLSKEKWIVVKDTHKGIIDKKIFQRVQNRIKSKVRSSKNGKTHMLSGKVICMDCKGTMIKITNGKEYNYLRCKTYLCNTNKKFCTNHSIRLDTLKKIVIDRIKEHIKLLYDFNNMEKSLNGENENYKDNLSKYLDGYNNDDLTTLMINELVDHIEIGEKNVKNNCQEVRIYWNF